MSLREDILTFQFSQMHLPLSSKEDIVSSVVFREEDKSATVTDILYKLNIKKLTSPEIDCAKGMTSH